MESPQRGREIQAKWVKIDDFDQYLAVSKKRCKIGTWSYSYTLEKQ